MRVMRVLEQAGNALMRAAVVAVLVVLLAAVVVALVPPSLAGWEPDPARDRACGLVVVGDDWPSDPALDGPVCYRGDLDE